MGESVRDVKKLSPRQMEAMKWLVGGHQPYINGVSVVYVNGQKLCNLDTMTALEKRGFAEKVTRYQWRITAKGGEYWTALAAPRGGGGGGRG